MNNFWTGEFVFAAKSVFSYVLHDFLYMFSVNISPAVQLFIFRFLCCRFFFLLFE